MNQDFSGEGIEINRRGPLGVITFDRPKALNALSLEMIRQVSSKLKQWEADEYLAAVIFTGAGGRAFCAGGDVKSFYHAGMDYRKGNIDHKVATLFFGEEYNLNKQIFHYPKPTIAYMNGITMGGGYGIAGNCRHRIVSEKTVFAMPEVGIGFFPDVGSVYHLLNAPHNFGRYIALTGTTVGPGDVMAAGLAEYFVMSDKMGLMMKAMESDLGGAKAIETVINDFTVKKPETEFFGMYAEKIESLFAHYDVFDLLKALSKDSSECAEHALREMVKKSPMSIMVTAEHLKRSQDKSFDEIIETDFTLAQRFVERMDLYEGIKGALIDKNYKPVWEPGSFKGVKPEAVEAYFKPTGHGLGDIEIFKSRTG